LLGVVVLGLGMVHTANERGVGASVDVLEHLLHGKLNCLLRFHGRGRHILLDLVLDRLEVVFSGPALGLKNKTKETENF